MSNILSFFSGIIVGAYLAQNYNIVNVKKTSENLLVYLKSLEKSDNSKKSND